MEIYFLIRPSKFAWMLMFACGSELAQAQSISTGKTDERPIGLPSKIDWTFNFDAAWGSFAFRNAIVHDPRENPRVDFGTHWKINRNFTASFVGAYANPQRAVEQASNRTRSFAAGRVYRAYAY